ncbi:MAG: WD40 repeat domain-containing protein, partial [Anaerolineales bacterium]
MHKRLVLLALLMGALILSACDGTVQDSTATTIPPILPATQKSRSPTLTETPVPTRTSPPTEMPNIVDVQLSPDRAYLIVQTTIGVYGYRASTQEEVWAFEDPSGIADMALPRLARWMAVATNDNRIALLIYKRGSLFTKFVSGFQQIDDLAFSPDDTLLAAVGDAGLAVWEVGQTKPLYRNIDLVGEVVRFTPDGEGITISHGSQLDVFSLSEIQLVKSISVKRRLTYSRLGEQYTDGFSIWDTTDHEKLIDLEMVA